MADTSIPEWNPSRSARDKPPRGSKPTTAKPKTTGKKPTQFRLSLDELESRANDAFEMLGGAGMMAEGTVWEGDGQILVAESERLAKSWRDLAEINPFVRKFLDTILFSGKTMEALMPTIMIGLAIASNHGVAVPFLPLTPQPVYEYKAKKKMVIKMQEAMEDMDPEELAAYEAMMNGASPS